MTKAYDRQKLEIKEIRKLITSTVKSGLPENRRRTF
jgi:hypothetical protein